MTPATRVVGTYAAQPLDLAARPEFARRVLELDGVTGLEITFGAAVYQQDQDWLWRTLPTGGRHVFTLVGATMEALSAEPAFGLASDDDAARTEALHLLAAARDQVARATASGHQITAVCVHSAPGGHSGSAHALCDSLLTAAAWDWAGAALVVEHCDAPVAQRPVQKGFLQLSDELAAVGDVARSQTNTRVGLSINWGRSAIETRSAHGPEAHLAEARATGLLAGLMLSGAADAPSAFGPAWQDAHLPMAGSAAEGGEPTSLLTSEFARQAVAAAGDSLLFDGVKVAIRPADASLDHRLATVQRAWRGLTGA